VKDYLSLWAGGLPERDSTRLSAPVSVMGEQKKHFGAKSEFARVLLTVHPAPGFKVEDAVTERDDLERLGVGWPDATIFGLLDVLMLADSGPLYKVRVVLEKVWYHEVDSSENASRLAGRDAGRKIIEAIEQSNRTDPGYEMT
jgi:translation elongation factor EF-G